MRLAQTATLGRFDEMQGSGMAMEEADTLGEHSQGGRVWEGVFGNWNLTL